MPRVRSASGASQPQHLHRLASLARTPRVRIVVACAVIAACRGDERPGTAQAVAAPAPPAAVAQDGGPPPGTDQLVPVPADVVAHVGLRRVAKGLQRPVLVTVAPGDPRGRLFVVEQRGAIRVIENGKLAKQPVFSIGGLATGDEQGLLGLALRGDRAWVNYTSADRNTHIVEYHWSGDAIDPKTAKQLIEIDQPYSNHNGGHLLFGPDGKLYTGMGDGGAANDPHRNGQNPKALLAKLLRFDVDAAKPTPEIVHIGLRNPWRFWFDSKTNDLYIGDVGQNLWEEVDVVPGSDHDRKNFGWNLMEGTHCFDAATGLTKDACDRTGLTLPVAEYSHKEGCSVTGGVTYRGKALPALDGVYFYADFCTGLLRSFRFVRGVVRDHWDWKVALDHEHVLHDVSSFGVDADGELYIVSLDGEIYELVPR